MSILRAYREKRDFSKTPEPAGKRSVSHAAPLQFVVQRHDARRLHYDFRLELDGVLKSWAVPKGISQTRGERRLAVQTEDHPVEYATFQGEIPKGEYGAGMVELWDCGTWSPVDHDASSALKRGKLEFTLAGKRLNGRWRLVRMNRDPKNWLLLYASEKAPEISGKSEKREGDRDAFPSLRPQLATLIDAVPSGSEWIHEVKLDGYRVLIKLRQGDVEIMTRRGNDWTLTLSQFKSALKALPTASAVLDGELVYINDRGLFDFQALQNSFKSRDTQRLRIILFDLLYLDGTDLRALSLIERKERLKSLLGNRSDLLLFSEHRVAEGESMFESACRLQLEGIISKLKDAPYTPGRSKSWVKVKCLKRQEFVIGGFTAPNAGRRHFGGDPCRLLRGQSAQVRGKGRNRV